MSEEIALTQRRRKFTVIAKATGDPITGGTVNYYAYDFVQAKWWRDTDQTWQATAQANPMSYVDDGHWTINLASAFWVAGRTYLEYVKESGNLHIADSRLVVGTSSGAASGSGGTAVTVTINEPGGSDPAAGAQVWITTDEAGTAIIAGVLTTDDFGQATFMLDAGTYYIWSRHPFYNDILAEELIVT